MSGGFHDLDRVGLVSGLPTGIGNFEMVLADRGRRAENSAGSLRTFELSTTLQSYIVYSLVLQGGTS